MSGRRLLIIGVMIAVMTAGSWAVLTLTDGREERSASSGEAQEPSSTNTSPTDPESRPSPIRFVLADSYSVGETIQVVIENVGGRAFLFESLYQACFLSYFDSSGRRFIIPPGTHCDILAKSTIKPGERKKLFTWSLDECVKDQWGCMKSKPLSPGTYTIRGRFKPRAGGTAARVETTFRIVAT
jgi:hypothetical protein